MINVKDQVYEALLKACDNVTDAYPSDWGKDVAIQYAEEENKVSEYADTQETKSYVRYRVDIWARRSTSAAAAAVDAAVSPLGLMRIQCQDVDDPSGMKHKQMRYEGNIDVKTQEMYRA